MKEMTVKQYVAIRREEALKIDPEAVEFSWCWEQVMDRYGVDPDLSEEYDGVGHLYFVRSPGSDIWISFDDLPQPIRDRIWERIRKGELRELDFIRRSCPSDGGSAGTIGAA